MKRISAVVIGVLLALTLSTPAFSQGGENNAWQAIQDDRNFQTKLQKMESFLSTYPNSAFRPDMDIQLMTMYVQNKDWGKMTVKAERFRLDVPTADPKSRAQFYVLAMEAARQVDNMAKMIEFGDRVLEADATNMSALLTLARNISERLPQDAAAKDTALNKALGYAKRAAQAPQGTIAAQEWAAVQGRVHSILGNIYFVKNQIPEAGDEYAVALKINPKDQVGQFRLGIAQITRLQAGLLALQAAMKDAEDAAKGPQAKLNELIDKREALTKDILSQRDAAIDSLARTVAMGGPLAEPARKQLETLYLNKNGGKPDGLDDFINQKKTELGL